jgi:hypothetical protein
VTLPRLNLSPTIHNDRKSKLVRLTAGELVRVILDAKPRQDRTAVISAIAAQQI